MFLALGLHQLGEEHSTPHNIRVYWSQHLLVLYLHRHQLHIQYRLVLEASTKQYDLFLELIARLQHSDLCEASLGFKLKSALLELKDPLLLLAYKLIDRVRILIEVRATK